MEREKTIIEIVNLIVKALDTNDYSYIRNAFILAYDYNESILGSDCAEIFMSEDEDYVCIEDDIFYFDGRF